MMKLIFAFVLMIGSMTSMVTATMVQNCPNSKATPMEVDTVKLSNCPKDKCLLKRNTEPSIEMKFTPTRDFKDLTSNIQGIILDVPLPFPGYYGTSACPHIYDAEGTKKVGCPLKAGQTYTYKNSFKVLPIYPTVNLVVHWGLGDTKGDAVCFRIPAKIKA